MDKVIRNKTRVIENPIGYILNQSIKLYIYDWNSLSIIEPIEIIGKITMFQVSLDESKIWIEWDEEKSIVLSNNVSVYLRSGWQSIEFVNKYIVNLE
jgi:hypothetical protein